MIKNIIILATLVVGLQGAYVPMPEAESEARIIGGSMVSIKQFPYTVSVQVKGEHFCTGTIYSESVIITTAQCLMAIKPADVKVRVGSSYLYREGSLMNVASFKMHDKYNMMNMDNNVALLRLETKILFNENAAPIGLSAEPVANGLQGVITGWGYADLVGPNYSDQLLMAPITSLGRAECSATPYGYMPMLITPSMFCGSVTGKDVCQGDAGSPFVVDGMLNGIASWGAGCGNAVYPAVYTDIAVVRDWIVTAAETV